MAAPTLRAIVECIEEQANPSWQEGFDNTGWQILLPGMLDVECSGLMICVDVTVDIMEEAAAKGCNMVLTHHPLLFRPTKCINGDTRVGLCVIEAIRKGISVYSCHTSVDKAPGGVSYWLAERLGMKDIEVLDGDKSTGIGIGVVGNLVPSRPVGDLVKNIKMVCGSPVARCSGLPSPETLVGRMAIGGGACADLIPAAIEAGAEIMVTSDVKHNFFIDYVHRIGIVDLGHYETEFCTKEIFCAILRKKFPNFVPYYSQSEKNPITYL